MRKAANLSQYELAARLGVTQPAISQIERGEHRSGFDTVQRWARACGNHIAFVNGQPTLADELASRLQEMSEDHVRELSVIIEQWTRLTSAQRAAMLGTLESEGALQSQTPPPDPGVV